VNTVEFPGIKKGKDAEFKKWFRWSNSAYAKFDGFISRRLLKPIDENGNTLFEITIFGTGRLNLSAA